MKVLVKENEVVAAHFDHQDVAGRYPGCLALILPDQTPVVVGRPLDVPLDVLKTGAAASIDAEAERRRLLAITPGAGQAQEYHYTAEEAARAAAAPDPLDPAGYPFLSAERSALADAVGQVSLRDVAVAVLADRAAWLTYGAAIKEVRRRAKLRIGAADSAEAVLAVLAGLVWPDAP